MSPELIHATKIWPRPSDPPAVDVTLEIEKLGKDRWNYRAKVVFEGGRFSETGG